LISAYKLTDQENEAVGAGQAEQVRRLSAFFEALLHAGMQSFSHMLAVLERYLQISLQLVGSDEARREVVKIVARVWSKHPQTVIIVLDRFQKYGILDASAIVHWSFDADALPFFRQAFFRDTLRNAVSWTVRYARSLRIAVDQAIVDAAKAAKDRAASTTDTATTTAATTTSSSTISVTYIAFF
jgi:hypothetical protein